MNNKIIFIGPLPPPYMGPTLATGVLLNSKLKDKYQLIHLDTSDHRDLTYLGRFDFKNIFLGIKSYFQLLFLILSKWPKAVYIPISQQTIGYLRDSIYILMARLFGRKVICHLRGGNFQNWLNGASGFTRFYVKIIHKLVNAQIVLGESLRPIFDGVIAPEKIHVVPNGKDMSLCEQEKDYNKTVILYLGNLKETKGVLDVLYASKLIYETTPEVEFLFAGAWSDLAAANKIKKFLADNPEIPVKVLGVCKGQDKLDLLCRANLFIFPTYYPNEGHPWVIVEAMASGMPIISTRHAAIPDTIIDDYNGYFVEKKSPTDIYQKAMAIINDRDKHQKMSANSIALYQERFTEKTMVEKMDAVFSHVLYK